MLLDVIILIAIPKSFRNNKSHIVLLDISNDLGFVVYQWESE